MNPSEQRKFILVSWLVHGNIFKIKHIDFIINKIKKWYIGAGSAVEWYTYPYERLLGSFDFQSKL